MTESVIHLSIDLRALSDALTVHVQRVSRFVGAALAGSSGPLLDPLRVRGRAMDYVYQPSLAWSAEIAQQEFDAWILLGAFRDLAEATTAFLGSVHSLAAIPVLHVLQVRGGHITPQQWQQHVLESEKRFEKANLPDKLRLLSTEHALDIPNSARTHIASLYRVRNCLVHRGGIVQLPDVDASGRLVASWLALNPFLVSSTGEQPLRPGLDVEAGSRIEIRHELNSKVFPLGGRVLFSAEEFHEIAYGFSLLGKEVAQTLEQRMRAVGIAFPTAAPSPGA